MVTVQGPGGPRLEDEEGPDVPPHAIVTAVEALHQALRLGGVEDGAAAYSAPIPGDTRPNPERRGKKLLSRFRDKMG